MSLFTIYIVDDEELIHNSLRAYIRRNFPDVEIVPFFSAVMFIRYLKKHTVENSLVILDHHFDIGISGSEAVGEIRRISKTLPIIFLTGVTDDSDITYTSDVNIHFKAKPISEMELRRTIKECIEVTETVSGLHDKVSSLELEVQSLAEQVQQTKQWAYDALQSLGVEKQGDIEDPKEWVEFQNNTLKYIEAIEHKETFNSRDKANIFKDIFDIFRKRYKRFDEKSIKFLATGEFLFEEHKEDYHIDFSPMLIAYSKCFENVLTVFLKTKGLILDGESTTLGTCVYIIKNNLTSLGLKPADFSKWYRRMHSFLQLRNKAAHPSGVSKSEFEKAKAFFFNMTETNKSEYLLDFLQCAL